MKFKERITTLLNDYSFSDKANKDSLGGRMKKKKKNTYEAVELRNPYLKSLIKRKRGIAV